MTETTTAAARRSEAAMALYDAIASAILQQVEPEDRQPLERFTKLFLARTPRELMSARTEEQLGQVILGAFLFLKSTQPHQVNVQVLNPDEDLEGWYDPVTVIRTNVSERPFIVDTLREFLGAGGWAIERSVYPIMSVSRSPDGRVFDVRGPHEGGQRESLVHMEIARVTDEETLDEIRSEVERRLTDVVRATDDFETMLRQVDKSLERLAKSARELPERAHELEETQSFLRWLKDGAFVFLGYRSYSMVEDEVGGRSIQVDENSGLGILTDEGDSSFASPRSVESLPASARAQVDAGPVLLISKTNAESPVHRRARMDYIGIKRLSADGKTVGEERFLGLFTSKAFSEDAERIPILRHKLAQIIERADVQEGSHDFKEIITIFNTMPKEELFLTPAEAVGDEIETVLSIYHTHEVRVVLRDDPLSRGASVTVILPRERFSSDVRRSIEHALVDVLGGGEVLNYHLALGSGDQARLHFHIAAAPDKVGRAELSEEVAASVRDLIRSWADRVREGLEMVRPPQEALRLARDYDQAFSAEYKASVLPAVAVNDILHLEEMRAQKHLQSVRLSQALDDQGQPRDASRFAVYLRQDSLVLSDFMPILENAGLRVIGMNPFEVAGEADNPPGTINVFEVQDAAGRPLTEHGTLLADTVLAVSAGDATNDSLNSLTIHAGLAWRQVDILRAYATYAFQLGAVPSRQTIPTALRKYPHVAALLCKRFRTMFDPNGPTEMNERVRDVQALKDEFRQALESVESLVDDRALRTMATLMNATVRTNYYRHGGQAGTIRSGGVPYISLKFDCNRMRDLAGHRLLFEVWVRSSRMEGVHLRGAKVARGGIRWSDRPDDFRTEILGLVETQMVKNAVIVPAGSKGGFVPLRDLSDRDAQADDAREQYKTLVRGLLDLTDNLVDGEPERPEGIVAYDDADPYLVVAADKGTAKFSDVANGVAAEYGFWLSDAFASGGSNGYDHKVVGITARGGWECVRRHFREMGKDIQTEPFTVVGIGDMSGDVFGNGMLLSRQIRLLAAFDHRHIFLDPDPDPEPTFVERQRLFDMGRSSWEDYDTTLLSEGGMIVPRGSKEVVLTPQVIAALQLPEDTEPLDGESLIRAILKAPAELLWNGGIGTYVKASFETHTSAGDPQNDRVRIDAPELRARVVGEGGNLGFTTHARIQYALAGGRINTDALDNSGGVDLSDREVNLKILLAPIVAEGRITNDERNALLERLTDEVAESVLKDNFSQSRAVSLDEARLKDRVDDFRELMVGLEREGLLDRAGEGLPTWEELSERLDRGQNLTRPELAVLLSYAKIHMTRGVLDSGLPDDPSTEHYLVRYFPAEAAELAGSVGLAGHRLRREIIAGQLTNELVDLMGATFVYKVANETGHTPAEVVRAWLTAAQLAGHESVLGVVAVRQELSTRVVYRWLAALARVLERTTRWLLPRVSADESVAEIVERNAEQLAELRAGFAGLVRGKDQELFDSRVAEMVRHGATQEFAEGTITLRFLDHLLEILVLGRETGNAPLDAAAAYYRISDVIHVPWLRSQIFRAAGEGRWDQRAAQALSDDLSQAHRALTARVLTVREGGDVDSAAERVAAQKHKSLKRLGALVEEIQSDGASSLSAMAVAVREVTALAARLDAG